MTLNFLSSYTVTIERTINGQKLNSQVSSLTTPTQLMPLINVSSVTEYSNIKGTSFTETVFLSTHNSYTKVNDLSFVRNYQNDYATLTYPINGTPINYTTQTVSTSINLPSDTQIENLLFDGWYLNGILYSTKDTIKLPINEVSTDGLILIYQTNGEQKTIVQLVELTFDSTNNRYKFEYNSSTYYIDLTDNLENFTGSIVNESNAFNYIYIPSDNITLTAAYSTYTKVSYQTNPTTETGDNLVQATLTGNLLGIVSNNSSITSEVGSYSLVYDEIDVTNRYENIFTSKLSSSKEYLGEYRLISTIDSYLIDNYHAAYVLSGSNLLITAGHLIGYRVIGYQYTGRRITVSSRINASGEIIYSYGITPFTTPISIESVSENNSMGYLTIGNNELFTDITITVLYEKVYEVSTVVSTIGEYDDDKIATAAPGGSIEISSYNSNNDIDVSDGTFYSDTYDVIRIKCIPNEGYTFVGLYLNGKYLGANELTFDTYNYEKIIDIIPDNLGFAENNRQSIVFEARFAKNVDFSIRIEINNSSSVKEIFDRYGITKENHSTGLNINVKLQSIYDSISYGSSTDEFNMESATDLQTNVWETPITKVKQGHAYDSSLEYFTDPNGENIYTYSPADSANWTTLQTATEGNALYVRDNRYLIMNFTVAYGTYVQLSVPETDNNQIRLSSGTSIYYKGWHLYRPSLHEHPVITDNNMLEFFATHDYYSSTMEFVAVFNTDSSSHSTDTHAIAEFIDETSNTLLRTMNPDNIDISNYNNGILTISGNNYLFTGWWNRILDSSRPTTDILISNNFLEYINKDLPRVNNLIAKFVKINPISITLPTPQSGYITTNLTYRYFYTATSVTDNRVQIVTSDSDERFKLTFNVPVDTYLSSTKTYAYSGHYYTINNSGTRNNYASYTIPTEQRLNNTIGTRYSPNVVYYAVQNSTIYYLDLVNRKAYTEVYVDGNSIAFRNEYTEITFTASSVKFGTIERSIETGQYVIIENNIHFLAYDKLYADLFYVNESSLANYRVSNSIVIHNENNANISIGLSTFESVKKAGYNYNVESDYDHLSIINGGHTISYIVTTVEDDGHYGSIYDNTAGGSISSIKIRTTGGTNSTSQYIYSATYPILEITLAPNVNYTFVGLYINDKYVQNSYNNLNLIIDLSLYDTDLVIDARFSKNISIEYRLSVGRNDSRAYIYDDLKIINNELALSGTISNVYNSINATFGDDIEFGSSIVLSDIDIKQSAEALSYIITVPYGTRLTFSTERTTIHSQLGAEYKFNGWYVFENGIITTNTPVTSSPTFTVYAVNDSDGNSLSFVADYEIDANTPGSLSEISNIELYTSTSTTPLTFSEIEFNSRYKRNNPNASIVTIEGKKYLFTGWWQVIRDDYKIFVSNIVNATSLPNRRIGRYVELTDITIKFSEKSAISIEANLHQAFSYIQSTTLSSSMLNARIDSESNTFVVTTTINSALTNVRVKAHNSYYFRNTEPNEYGNYPYDITSIYLDRIDDEFVISTNIAEIADVYMRYSKIYSGDDEFAYNVEHEIQEDKLVVFVQNNANSFKVSIVAQNISKTEANSKATASSMIYIASTNIHSPSLSQIQSLESSVKTVYINGQTVFILNNTIYESLEAYKTYYDLSKQIIPNLTGYSIVTLSGTYYLTNSNTFVDNDNNLIDNSIVFGASDAVIVMDYTVNSSNPYTLYVYSSVSSKYRLIEPIGANNVVCQIRNTETNENLTLPISFNAPDKFYSVYTKLNISLVKEYRKESFVGFKILYDNGKSILYDAKTYGYSFSIVVTESITIIAQFEDAVNTQDHTNYDETTVPDINYGSSVVFGDGDESQDEYPVTLYTAQEGYYIQLITIYTVDINGDQVIYQFDFDLKTNLFNPNGNIPSGISVVGDDESKVQDSFGQFFYKSVKVAAPENATVETLTYKIYTLNITITQNEVGSWPQITMLYPHDYLQNNIYNTPRYVQYQGIINNDTLLEYIKNNLLDGTRDYELGTGFNFSNTLVTAGTSSRFIDGFYTMSIDNASNYVSNVLPKLDGNTSDVDASGKFTKYFIQISTNSPVSYSLRYNFQTQGKIRVYVHPYYYDTNESTNYNPNLEQSLILPSVDEREFVTNSIHVGNKEDINGNIQLDDSITYELNKNDYEHRGNTGSSEIKGVWYYEISYYFSDPLSLYFDSQYLSFDKFYYYDTNNNKQYLSRSYYEEEYKVNNMNPLTLKTNNSSLTMSYDEYLKILAVTRKDVDPKLITSESMINSLTPDESVLVLHCDAKEDIKSTILKFDFNQPTINLSFRMNDDTYTSTVDASYSNGNQKTVTLSADNGKEYSITIQSYELNESYYMRLIYSKELIANNANFTINLKNFIPKDQYKGTVLNSENSKIKIFETDTATYKFNNAYCTNTTQTININNEIDQSPKISFVLGDTFSDSNEINIETRLMNKILLANDKSNAGLINISISKPDKSINDNPVIISNETTTDYANYVLAYAETNSVVRVFAEHPNRYMFNSNLTSSLSSIIDVIEGRSTSYSYNETWATQTISTMKSIATLTTSPSTVNQQYTYVPNSNAAFLVDYYGCDSEIQPTKIVGIIAPGNASSFIPSGDDSIITTISSYESGFNFIIEITKLESETSVSYKQQINGEYYSATQVIEENGKLYTTNKDDSKVAIYSIPKFENTTIKMFLNDPQVKQYILLVSANLNKTLIRTGIFYQMILPELETSVEIDYVTERTIDEYDVAEYSSTSVLYTLNTSASFTTAGSYDPNETYFQASTKTAPVHGMTLDYLGKTYYIVGNSTYESITLDNGEISTPLSTPINTSLNALKLLPHYEYDNYYVVALRLGYYYSHVSLENRTFYYGYKNTSSEEPKFYEIINGNFVEKSSVLSPNSDLSISFFEDDVLYTLLIDKVKVIKRDMITINSESLSISIKADIYNSEYKEYTRSLTGELVQLDESNSSNNNDIFLKLIQERELEVRSLVYNDQKYYINNEFQTLVIYKEIELMNEVTEFTYEIDPSNDKFIIIHDSDDNTNTVETQLEKQMLTSVQYQKQNYFVYENKLYISYPYNEESVVDFEYNIYPVKITYNNFDYIRETASADETITYVSQVNNNRITYNTRTQLVTNEVDDITDSAEISKVKYVYIDNNEIETSLVVNKASSELSLNSRLSIEHPSSKSTNLTLKSITASAPQGYIIKGFVVASNYELASANSLWISYRVDEGAQLFGLQGEDYYSRFKYYNLYQIAYDDLSSNSDMPSASNATITMNNNEVTVELNLDMKLFGEYQVYAIYSPIIYEINYNLINIHEIINSDTDGTEYAYKDNFIETYYSNKIFEQDPTVGYVKGQVIVSNGRDTSLRVYSNAGSKYVGHSVAKDSPSTTIETFYAGSAEELEDAQLTILSNDIYNSSYSIIAPDSSVEVDDTRLNVYGSVNKANHIKIQDITNNVKLYLFFNSITYALDIQITESENGVYFNNNYESDYYLSYSQELTRTENFNHTNEIIKSDDNIKNIQTIYQNGNLLSQEEDKTLFDDNKGYYRISDELYKNISSTDPLVYTIFDNYGNLITTQEKLNSTDSSTISKYNNYIEKITPTPILSKTIDFEMSRKVGFLVYNSTSEYGNRSYFVPSLYVLYSSSNTVPQSLSLVPNGPFEYYVDKNGNYYVQRTINMYYIKRVSAEGSIDNPYLDPTISVEGYGNGNTISTSVYFRAIPYTAYEIYAEYGDEFVENEINKSKGLQIYQSKNIDKTITEDVVSFSLDRSVRTTISTNVAGESITANNTYIYSIFNLNKSANSNEYTYIDGYVNHVPIDEIELHTIGTFTYLTHKTPLEKNGRTYYLAVSATPKEIGTDGDDWWINYTTSYIDRILSYYNDDKNNVVYKEQYEKYAKTLIFGTDFDTALANKSVYNISSLNVNNYLSDYTKYIDIFNDGQYRVSLKKNLFTLNIDEYSFDSSAFSNNITEIRSAESIIGNAGKYTASMTFKTVTINGEIKYNIMIRIKIGYNSTGSLPIVSIEGHNNVSDTTNYNLNFVGQSSSYDRLIKYSDNNSVTETVSGTDTIYKPINLIEKVGTKYKPDAAAEKITDTYFSDKSTSEGYFQNIYTSAMHSDESSRIPNLNLKIQLIYSHQIKAIDATVAINTNNNVEFGYDYKKSAQSIDLINKTQNELWYKTFDSKATNEITSSSLLYSNVLLSQKAKEAQLNEKKTSVSEAKISGWMIEHYYVYLIKDAYHIMNLLHEILHYLTDEAKNEAEATRAMNYQLYILNYDPEMYNEQDYVFSDSYSETERKYSELYSFIESNISNMRRNNRSKYENLYNDLPSPNSLNTSTQGVSNASYMKVRKIDIFSSYKRGVDVNFIQNYFTQNDLVITSLAQKEKFQHEVQERGAILGNPDWNVPWRGYQGYSYYDNATAFISASLTTPTYKSDAFSAADFSDGAASNPTLVNIYKAQQQEGGNNPFAVNLFVSLVGTYLMIEANDFSGTSSSKGNGTEINQITSTIYINSYQLPKHDGSDSNMGYQVGESRADFSKEGGNIRNRSVSFNYSLNQFYTITLVDIASSLLVPWPLSVLVKQQYHTNDSADANAQALASLIPIPGLDSYVASLLRTDFSASVTKLVKSLMSEGAVCIYGLNCNIRIA